MAYGTKYSASLTDISGNTFTVNIKQNGYSSSTTTIEAYSLTPLAIKYFGDRDDKSVVNGSECSFTFYWKTGDTISEILESEYQDYQLEVLKNSSLYWLGWLKPDNISAKYIGNYFISLTASDGLADLKSVEYPVFSTNRVTAIYIIKTCLSQLLLDAMDIESQLSTYDNILMSNGDSTLDISINQLRFETTKDGREYNLSCYTVLEYLLKPFQAKIYQSAGKWCITNKNEVDSKKHIYTYSTLALSTSDYDRTINLDNVKVMFGSDELSKIQPLRKFEVTYRNKTVDETIIPNGTFDSDINGWNNGTGATEAFYYIGYSSGKMSLQDQPSMGHPNANHYVYTDPFYAEQRGSTTLPVTWSSSGSISYTGVTNAPRWRMDLIQPNGVILTGSEQVITTSSSDYTETFSITQDGDHVLKLWIRPYNFGSYMSGYNLLVDNVSGIPVYASSAATTFDVYINGAINANVKQDEDTIYFADGLLTNDVGNIKYGTDLTSAWNTYGNSEDLTLQRLYIYNELRQYKRFKNYLRLVVKSTEIAFGNCVVIGSKIYNINGYSYEIKNGKVSLELSEYLEVNPSISYTETTLSTVDGIES